MSFGLPISTDGTFAADSDALLPTQKAVKTYVGAYAGGTTISPYIVGPTGADYTDIQAAIDAAVIAGYNNANPINIYLKPGSYSNSYDLAAGINLVAISQPSPPLQNSSLNTLPVQTVTIDGTITASLGGGKCLLNGINFTTNAIDFQQGTLIFSNCNFGDDASIAFGAASGIQVLDCDGCTFVGTGSAITTSSTPEIIELYIRNCYFLKNVSIYPTIAATITMVETIFEAVLDIITTAVTLNAIDVHAYVNTSTMFSFAATGVDTVIFNLINVSTVADSLLYLDSSPTVTVKMVNCSQGLPIGTGGPFGTITRTAGLLTNNTSVTFIPARTGFTYSNTEMEGAVLQTVDATPTALVSVPLGTNKSIVLRGQVIGSSADKTNCVGGSFLVVANRQGAGTTTIIGTSDISVKSSSTATFTDGVSSPNVEIVVTGVAATTYNWTAYYTYTNMVSDF